VCVCVCVCVCVSEIRDLMDQFNKADLGAPRRSHQTKALRFRRGRSASPREKKRARRVYNSSDFLLANNHKYARAKTSLPLNTDMSFCTLIYKIQQCNRHDLISAKKKKESVKIFQPLYKSLRSVLGNIVINDYVFCNLGNYFRCLFNHQSKSDETTVLRGRDGNVVRKHEWLTSVACVRLTQTYRQVLCVSLSLSLRDRRIEFFTVNSCAVN